jgi:erythromycin esterase-like protein
MRYLKTGLFALVFAFLSTELPAQETPTETLANSVYELTDTAEDIDRILEAIGDARIVLIGESTHGTHEFYRMRAEITQALIEEQGFDGVAIEGRWTDAYRVNQYVLNQTDDHRASEALSNFTDFPVWMWRNTDVRLFVEWLRLYNAVNDKEVGFYGLDLYGVYPSIEAVVEYLEGVNQDAADEARELYTCFDDYGGDLFDYGAVAAREEDQSCEDEAQEAFELVEEQRSDDDYLNAIQNARVVVNGEAYYRLSFLGVNTWNVRDQHMMETLVTLDEHHSDDEAAKLVVWAHNSHVGDARATERSTIGELNIGQLAREHYEDESFLIGFTTYTGTVMAADAWDFPGQVKEIEPGMEGSYELLFHEVGIPIFMLVLHDNTPEALAEERIERAIGVIYQSETERQSHYFRANLAEQFDLVIHIDTTSAVRPLEDSN